MYSTAKETRKFVTFKLIKIKYVEFKKYILHIKLTVYYTVSFTCNIYSLNSTYLVFNQIKSYKFSRFFSDPIDQDIRTQRDLSWKKVVLEWRSVIAVSLNVSGGVRLIKPAKPYMCTQNTRHTEVMCLIKFRTLGRWLH